MMTDSTASTDQQIRAAADEAARQQTLLKEIHHRVKNNLQIVSSLLSLQATHIKDPQAREAFKESQNRIKTMALMHERLQESNQPATVDVAGYIHSLIDSLLLSYAADPSRISVRVDVQDVALGSDTSIPCGLMINELVSNALKYAFPDGRAGQLRVELRREGDRYLLRVADDGVGLPDGFDLGQVRTLGLSLVETLSEQLNGSLVIGPGPGTVFEIRFAEMARKTMPGSQRG